MEIIIILHVFCRIKSALKKAKVLSYGINKLNDKNINLPGIHAETNAILKLKKQNNKKLEKIDILVIRLTGTNKLQNSKPCHHCIMNMKRLAPQKGYKIINIYYSDENKNIIKTNLTSLEIQEHHYSRYFNAKKNYNFNCNYI